MTRTTDQDHLSETARRQALQRSFIVLLALVVSGVFIWMIRDFLAVLFLAGVLTLLLMPVQTRLTALFGGRARLSAVLVLLLSIIGLLIPLLLILGLAGQQAVEVSQIVIPWVQTQIAQLRAEGMSGLPDWMPLRDQLEPYQAEFTRQLGGLATSVGSVLVEGLRRATGGTFGFLLNTIVLIFALYLFLVSGQGMAQRTVELLPMPTADRALLAERTLSTIRATVKGTFVIALIQGVLVGLAFAVLDLPGAAFWGMVCVILSIIPMVGPPLVWVPAAVWLFFNGQPVEAIGLAIYGAAFVGVIDNILRPLLVGKDAKMSDLLVLLSTLGGLTLFGALGIIIGPVVAALFTSVWYIYAQSYAPLLTERARDDADAETSD